ncbi:glycosyltransferase [Campylobacter sp. RM13119]|uniref:glycosyltransferase n=1 Tax=Campylobacter californiensis TaxID=1032243 RepID=UPI0014733CA5|nr:glycosyltransferase [Campylobacter sp. RM13119]MBE3605369.1 glycosyltransferase [Campylobacter sp. RM13119]
MRQEVYYKNYEEKPIKLSIITATWNVEKFLPRVIKNLQEQSDKDFEWIISDGASSDKTLEILKNTEGINIKIISGEDFGIYDALNKGIKACNGEFYLVIGADDELYPDAIKDYKDAIDGNVDIVTAYIDTTHDKSKPNSGARWIKAQFHYVSAHAVGSIYRTSLHKKFGYYSRKFPIAADQLFILTAAKYGVKIKTIQKVVGKFSDDGVSSIDTLGTICEFYRVQIAMGENKFLQTALFILRLIKNFRKM